MMIIMEKERMLSTVLKELEKIPKIKGNLPQNLFRGTYYWLRMHSLKEGNVSRAAVFCKAFQMIKNDYPEFKPIADTEFFVGCKPDEIEKTCKMRGIKKE